MLPIGSLAKPSVVFILTDDQSRSAAGIYGNTVVQTPNIDQLGREGMVFDFAFTSTGMCVPSRSTLYTGLHPMRHGAHENQSAASPNILSVTDYLRPLGYKVGLIGKLHVSPASVFPWDFMEELLDTGLTKSKVKQAIQSFGASPSVLFVCIHSPHTPWVTTLPYLPGTVGLPPYLYHNSETRKAMSNYFGSVTEADSISGVVIQALKELGTYDSTLVFIASDNGSSFPQGKWDIYDESVHMPFMARWPGHVAAGVRSNALLQFTDVLPTFIELAGGAQVDSLDGRSFLPVLLGTRTTHNTYAFGTSTSTGSNGVSNYPIRMIRSQRYQYILNLEPTWSWTSPVTLGTDQPAAGDFAYWQSWLTAAQTDTAAARIVQKVQRRPVEEFYDVQADPFEMYNRIGLTATDTTLCRVRKEHRAQLRNWVVNIQHDTLVTSAFWNSLPSDVCSVVRLRPAGPVPSGMRLEGNRLRVTRQNKSPLVLEIFNVHGRKLNVIHPVWLNHEAEFRFEGLQASGLVILKLKQDGKVVGTFNLGLF